MVEIPASLLPNDLHFASGPSKVRQEAISALQNNLIIGSSHRKKPFLNMVEELFDGIKQLYKLPSDYEIIIGNGGTTLFWDALTHSVIRKKSQHLSFGEFSNKFSGVVKKAPFLDDPSVITSDFGSAPVAIEEEGIDAYCLTHNETSTGVQTKIVRPSSNEDALVLVDATSAAGAIELDLTQTDIYYFAPQKAFSSEGGLFMAFCSPKAVERIEEIASSDRYIPDMLNLKTALDNSRKFTTYNTPSVTTLLLLKSQVDFVNEKGGISWADEYTQKNSNLIYEWADSNSKTFPYVEKTSRSQVTCTINFDGIDADDVAKHLRANGILDVESYRKIGQNQLRIATFPSITSGDVQALIKCIDYVVENM
jgi:phosphoserine aminotransferase